MKNLKKLSITLAIALSIIPSKLAFSKPFSLTENLFNKPLYENSYFSVQENNLNLIINNISTNRKNILIDGYFLNNSKNKYKTITNFNLKIKDENNNLILDAIFPEIPLENGLNTLEGKKIILSLPKDKKVKLTKLKELSNIYYEFTYNYTLN
ncbi:MAG: hypothetical protein ACRDD2_04315 [Sarcina sp.]